MEGRTSAHKVAQGLVDISESSKEGTKVGVQNVTAQTAEISDATASAADIVTVGLAANGLIKEAGVVQTAGLAANGVSLGAKAVHILAGGEKHSWGEVILQGVLASKGELATGVFGATKLTSLKIETAWTCLVAAWKSTPGNH